MSCGLAVEEVAKIREGLRAQRAGGILSLCRPPGIFHLSKDFIDSQCYGTNGNVKREAPGAKLSA